MDLQETVIGTKEIYNGRIVHLRVDRVRFPNGDEANREIVAHHGSVCIVPIHEGNILMLRQFRLATGKVLLEAPAGMLEPDEAPEVAAARELGEETGYRAGTLLPMFSAYLAPGYSTELMHFYFATDLTPTEAHPDEDEYLELVPLPIPEVERLILMGEVQDAKTIAAVLAAIQMLRARI